MHVLTEYQMFTTVSQPCVLKTTASWEIQGQNIKVAIPQKSCDSIVDVFLSSLIFILIHTHFLNISYPFSLSSIFPKATCFLKSSPLCMVKFCFIRSFNSVQKCTEFLETLHSFSFLSIKSIPRTFPFGYLYWNMISAQITIYKFCSAASQALLLLMTRGSVHGAEHGVHTRT